MPVRKIPRNYRNVTGQVASNDRETSAAFESSLERDFHIILDFDLNVLRHEDQPVTIEYVDESGKNRKYTPDVLVTYRKDIAPAKDMKPWLCEVKYSNDIVNNIATYAPKFKAGREYARSQEWEFRIMTEHLIRTPYLDNVKFLRDYRGLPSNGDFIDLIMNALYEMRETDPEMLLLAISADKWKRAEVMPYLWNLISNRRIGIDLRQPLKMRSRIWYLDTRY